MSKKSLRLRRHETFSIREGWIEKGLIKLNNNPQCMKKDGGPRNLGLGSNMVKSLRYWLTACQLVTFNSQTGGTLTNIANVIFEYDMYLEKRISWWIIHYYLVTNFEDAPVFNRFFNMPITKVEKESLVLNLKESFEEEYELGAVSSLEDDVTVLLKTYSYSYVDDPENNSNCPLGKLGLLKPLDKKIYMKTQPTYDSLDSKVIYIAICDYCRENGIEGSFNLEDYMNSQNNVLSIFNINKSSLIMYLEELRKKGWITLIKTAGLNTVRIIKDLTLKEVLFD